MRDNALPSIIRNNWTSLIRLRVVTLSLIMDTSSIIRDINICKVEHQVSLPYYNNASAAELKLIQSADEQSLPRVARLDGARLYLNYVLLL